MSRAREMLDLNGRVAIVTGASSGIGRETAKLLAERGAAVVLVARRKSLLKELEREIKSAGGRAVSAAADLTMDYAAEEVCATAVEVFGKIDIVVNNAGISDNHWDCVNTGDELWNANLALNQTALFRMCRCVLRYMTERNSGCIVNLSSIGGVYSIAGAAYSAAKMAVIGLTKNIAIQYAGSGIRCNTVCPGATDTEMLRGDAPHDERMMEITSRRIDMTTGMCEPSDIANAILFFCSEESRFINGQCLVIDKGSCI